MLSEAPAGVDTLYDGATVLAESADHFTAVIVGIFHHKVGHLAATVLGDFDSSIQFFTSQICHTLHHISSSVSFKEAPSSSYISFDMRPASRSSFSYFFVIPMANQCANRMARHPATNLPIMTMASKLG